MSRIHVLSDNLANKIAAGEVVERPASVVKELVENALDAGTTQISVTVTQGGRSLIEVEDDGAGMSREDAELSIQRHATSKLTEVEDLDAIATLGFRGEALPSIASVSRFTLTTADTDEGEGTRIELDGGQIQSVRPHPSPRGTTITVEELFFNVPARRKFLRTPQTELAHITRVVTSYALAFPEVAFRLVHGGRELLDLPSTTDLSERTRAALPGKLARDATYLDRDLGEFSVRAVLPPFTETRANRDAQYLFVNRRLVRDRVLSHAIAMAYEPFVPKGRHPSLVILLDMHPSRVDVNVHPTKAEVRLQDSRRIHQLLYGVLRSAYQQRGEVAPLPVTPTSEPVNPQPFLAGGASLGTERSWPSRPQPTMPVPLPSPTPVRPRATGSCAASDQTEGLEHFTPGPQEIPRIIGQFRRTFILAADAQGLLLIDQHVAHERILYEETFARLGQPESDGQPLLVPKLLELTADQELILRDNLPQLQTLGFQIEEFGGGGYAVREAPAFLADYDPASIISEILEDLTGGVTGEEAITAARHELAAGIACRAAIKARRNLDPQEQRDLVARLWRCDSRHHCPHGRPVMMRLSYDQIARHFERR